MCYNIQKRVKIGDIRAHGFVKNELCAWNISSNNRKCTCVLVAHRVRPHIYEEYIVQGATATARDDRVRLFKLVIKVKIGRRKEKKARTTTTGKTTLCAHWKRFRMCVMRSDNCFRPVASCITITELARYVHKYSLIHVSIQLKNKQINLKFGGFINNLNQRRFDPSSQLSRAKPSGAPRVTHGANKSIEEQSRRGTVSHTFTIGLPETECLSLVKTRFTGPRRRNCRLLFIIFGSSRASTDRSQSRDLLLESCSRLAQCISISHSRRARIDLRNTPFATDFRGKERTRDVTHRTLSRPRCRKSSFRPRLVEKAKLVTSVKERLNIKATKLLMTVPSTACDCSTDRVCVLAILAAHQASPYLATTPPIRPVPFTSAADRRDPRRAAFCVAPATRWSTRAVPDLVFELVRVLQVQCCSDPESPRSVPVGVPSVRRAVSTTARSFVPFPLYLASRTLVGDEHPLVWRVVHRQSRPGRGEVDTGGVHGEATVTAGYEAHQSGHIVGAANFSRLLRGHTLLASPPELNIFFRTRCLVPSCECGSRFCRRWQVPSLLCRLHLVSVVLASGATL
ncbi:unnamed protein product [Trichogramma brassicae]|uniref:Uncharacterized protein n=1 Tax=Trichogramma brassicae TaxID=86971 RepID=A0A6H5IQJ1_9HYME|nr:unnamed protein product [Trichogramma brassicae]